MTGGIYCIENKIDGKKYIGKDSCLPKRMVFHLRELKTGRHINTYLQNAWNKYGEENFDFYVIEECENKSLSENEVFYIKYLETKSPNGYNCTDGGEGTKGRKHSPESLEKMRISHTGIKHSEETKKKISNSNMGHVLSDEARKKISDANSGKNSVWFGRKHTKEEKLKIGMGNKGKIVSEETRKKLSITSTGRKAWNKGIPLSEETKKKISDTHRKRKEE